MYDDDDRSGVHCIELYENSTGLHSDVGGTLLRSDYPSYFAALETDRVVDAHDAETDPRTCELAGPYSDDLGISSILDGPTRLNGELIGIMCIEHVGEARRWTTEEIAFVGSLTDLLAHAVDAHDRVLIEKELHEIEFRYARAARIAKLGHWAWDMIEDKLIYSSKEAAAFHGFTVEEYFAKASSTEHLIKLIHPDDQEAYRQAWQDHVESKSGFEIGFSVVLPDGNIRHLKEFVEAVLDDEGRLIQTVGTNMDISDIRRAEREAILANKAKSEFLSSMSHELRTPMNAILGFGQMLGLSSKEPLTSKQEEFVNHIMKGGQHLLSLIDQVLELAKIESGKTNISLETVELNNVLRECLTLIGPQAKDLNLVLTSDMAATNDIKADHSRFRQVILNLLSNAIKFNHEGGIVNLSSKDARDNMVVISVTDTGDGFSEEAGDGVFEAFNRLGRETGDIGGTGIGLTITKQLVDAMEGNIGFESQVGKGSTFWVEFPVTDSRPVERLEPDKISEINVRGEPSSITSTILYIEDNPANLQLMKTIIDEIDGIAMISAHNAELGLSIAKEQQPDLILMDISLPGMDGIAAMKAIRAIDKCQHIPVIAVTAAASKKDIERGSEVGFKAYLTKPFNVPELISAIRRELGN